MAEPALTQVRDAPGFKVFVAGNELPAEVAVDILDVEVCSYIEGSNTFAIRFNNWDSNRQEFKGIDQSNLREGAQVEVRIGFVDALKALIQGEVTAIEPEFHESEAPTLKVQGYDRLHRFRRGNKTRAFTKMKDSQIAEQIATDLGLRAQVEDTQVTHDYVLQANQTDIDFLRERASRIRYEVIVKDKTLHFRKAAEGQNQAVTLEYGLTLKWFYPRLSTMRQVSEVVVQGWDPKSKKTIVGRARQSDVSTKMGGAKLGAEVSEQAFFSAKSHIVDMPVFSDSEASQMAVSKFNDMAVGFICGEGMAIGNTDIIAGSVVQLNGLGRFGGSYYVTSAKHVVNEMGCTTQFTVMRNAV